MRNSKAKQLVGRSVEMAERRRSRARNVIEHKPKPMFTGELNMDGTPKVVYVVPRTLVNENNFYKTFKKQIKSL